LQALHKVLTQTNLRLDPLLDRRGMIGTFSQEPLYLALVGVLSLGAVIALLLALVGNLLSSWLSVRTRLTNFAVLRALGAAPRQVAGVLAWEQAIISVTAILEGIIFGIVLAFLAMPALIYSSVLPNNQTGAVSSSDFYAVQTVPAITIVIPPSVLYTLAGLAAICVIAIVSMALVVARPSIGQTLRLNQD
jgi:ABC-type antimicrobial peptide transport system permease subunit